MTFFDFPLEDDEAMLLELENLNWDAANPLAQLEPLPELMSDDFMVFDPTLSYEHWDDASRK